MRPQYFLLFIFLLSTKVKSQSLSPAVLCSGGSTFSAGGSTLTWTLGETANTTLQNGTLLLTQGEQQPYIEVRLLNLKAYIEGFYAGSGLMTPVLYNNYPGQYAPNQCDSITVELRAAASPYTVLSSRNVILLTNGTVQLQYPSSFAGSSCYIVVRHRNSIETWSKNPVSFNSSPVSYDFSAP